MGGLIITYAMQIMQQVIDGVFSRQEHGNTITGGVFKAREVVFDKFIDLINEGIKEEDELEMIQFLIEECHYTEDEIRAARNGRVTYHDYAVCLALFK